jgi:membrane protein insertase Oxa1/YidC/SpoIIIJ
MKKLKIKIGLTASRIVIIGIYMLRRPKHSKIDVVAPKEEEEEELIDLCPFNIIFWFMCLFFMFASYFVYSALVLFCVVFLLFSIYLSLFYFCSSLPTPATRWKPSCI